MHQRRGRGAGLVAQRDDAHRGVVAREPEAVFDGDGEAMERSFWLAGPCEVLVEFAGERYGVREQRLCQAERELVCDSCSL